MELSEMRGIGPARMESLRAVGIVSLRDLLYTLPVRYEDRTQVVPCKEARGEVLVSGVVPEAPKYSRFSGLVRVTASLHDDSGKLSLAWYNQPWMMQQLPVGEPVMLFGRVAEKNGRRVLQNAAIVTEPVSHLPFADKIRAMLEDMGYTGFSNFDIKYTGQGEDYRVFEINLRQGRSNFYVTSAGINIARLAAEVYESEGEDCLMCENVHFWHHVPRSVAYTYTEDASLVKCARDLARRGKHTSSLWYTKDLCLNPLRLICVCEVLRRQGKKFKKYYPTQK